MTLQQKIELMKTKMFDLISTKQITFLNELDNRIDIDKYGPFKYHKSSNFEQEDIKHFLNILENNKIYIIIPFISKNCRINEPYIILSRQILITNKSNDLLLSGFINEKIEKAIELYNMVDFDGYYSVLKYKTVDINFNTDKTFGSNK